MDYKPLARRMKQIKDEKKLMFEDIEKATGFSFMKVCRLLRGDRVPTLSEFAALCKALGASADELLNLNEK